MSFYHPHRPFRRLSGWLKERYGERVFKVSIRAGFSCPNRKHTGRGCTFCAGASLEPTGFEEGQTIQEQLQNGISYLDRRHQANKVIAYFQDYTATYDTTENLRKIYSDVLEEKKVVALAIGTRPDCLSESTLTLLSEISIKRDLWLELGLQIADDAYLEKLNRGHNVKQFIAGVKKAHAHGLKLCIHVIIGLPGVSHDTELKTIKLLNDLGVWGIKLHAFHLLHGSEMGEAYLKEPYPLLEKDEYIQRVVHLIENIPEDVIIHRITGEAPRRLTIAPEWTVNKMGVFDAVIHRCNELNTWQGKALLKQ